METHSSDTQQVLRQIADRLERLAEEMHAFSVMYSGTEHIKVTSAVTAYQHAVLIVKEYMS